MVKVSPFSVSPLITSTPWVLSASASSVMNRGIPLSSLSASVAGPWSTNQPSPIAGMIAATTARPTSITWWRSARERRSRVTRPWAPSIAPVTKHPCSTTISTAMPGRTEPPGSGRATRESSRAVTAATAATSQVTSTGIRVARGISASTASTTSRAPSHHGPPTPGPKRPSRRSEKPSDGNG